MRVIAGAWRGRKLIAPAGETTRPTADRTRETLFSMLASRVGSFDGLRVADLYAGSGALGIEALSRGAAHVTFVDHDRDAVRAITANLQALGGNDRATILSRSANALPRGMVFDLILADPPYADGAGKAALAGLAGSGWIASATWIAIETARTDRIDQEGLEDGLAIEAERDVGRARLTILSV